MPLEVGVTLSLEKVAFALLERSSLPQPRPSGVLQYHSLELLEYSGTMA